MPDNELILVTPTGKRFTLNMPDGATFEDLKQCADQIVNFCEHSFGQIAVHKGETHG